MFLSQIFHPLWLGKRFPILGSHQMMRTWSWGKLLERYRMWVMWTGSCLGCKGEIQSLLLCPGVASWVEEESEPYGGLLGTGFWLSWHAEKKSHPCCELGCGLCDLCFYYQYQSLETASWTACDLCPCLYYLNLQTYRQGCLSWTATPQVCLSVQLI